MNIKEIEMRSGLTRANIRYYEKEGLLECQRKENGYRDYSEENLEQLKKILEELSKSRDNAAFGAAEQPYPAVIREDEELQEPHPWKRFFARGLDFSLYELILSAIWEGLLHQMTGDTILYTCGKIILIVLFMMAGSNGSHDIFYAALR